MTGSCSRNTNQWKCGLGQRCICLLYLQWLCSQARVLQWLAGSWERSGFQSKVFLCGVCTISLWLCSFPSVQVLRLPLTIRKMYIRLLWRRCEGESCLSSKALTRSRSETTVSVLFECNQERSERYKLRSQLAVYRGHIRGEPPSLTPLWVWWVTFHPRRI